VFCSQYIKALFNRNLNTVMSMHYLEEACWKRGIFFPADLQPMYFVKIWFEDPGKMAPVSLFSSFFPQTIMQEQ
jgi:hypothetical protein